MHKFCQIISLFWIRIVLSKIGVVLCFVLVWSITGNLYSSLWINNASLLLLRSTPLSVVHDPFYLAPGFRIDCSDSSFEYADILNGWSQYSKHNYYPLLLHFTYCGHGHIALEALAEDFLPNLVYREPLFVYVYGRLYWEQGDEEYAIKLWQYEQSIDLLWVALGSRAYSLGLDEQAEEFYQIAEKIDDRVIGGKWSMYRDWCRIMSQRQALGEALVNCRRYVDVMPSDSSWLQLGAVQALAMDFEAAIESYDKALAYSPNSGRVYAYKGSLYREMGDFEAAEIEFLRSISLSPEYSWAYIYLADMYIMQGKEYEARELLSIVLDHTDKNAVVGARRRLETLGFVYP